MELAPLSFYRLEFAKRAEWKREDERRDVEQTRQQKETDAKRERDKEKDSLEELMLVVLATDTDIADFTVKLDAYDTATVTALQDNEQAIEKVREELRVMIDKAYVMPDGRKVFKTEDGERVFDENGAEVKDFNPEQIEDWRPSWERLTEMRKSQQILLDERDQLHGFQDKLDEARERIGEDGLTKAELTELEQNLKADMPDTVKRHLPNDRDVALENETPAAPQAGLVRSGAKLDMPAL